MLNVLQRTRDVENPVLHWQLESSKFPITEGRLEWIKGQFGISAGANEEYRIEFQVVKGSAESNSFVTVDDLDFLQEAVCDFKPHQAQTTTSTTQTTPLTTPEPTEPPGRKSFQKFLHEVLIVIQFFS